MLWAVGVTIEAMCRFVLPCSAGVADAVVEDGWRSADVVVEGKKMTWISLGCCSPRVDQVEKVGARVVTLEWLWVASWKGVRVLPLCEVEYSNTCRAQSIYARFHVAAVGCSSFWVLRLSIIRTQEFNCARAHIVCLGSFFNCVHIQTRIIELLVGWVKNAWISSLPQGQEDSKVVKQVGYGWGKNLVVWLDGTVYGDNKWYFSILIELVLWDTIMTKVKP